jgi:hypothetical protein
MEHCLQVTAINRRVEQVNDGWIALTSLEVWDDRVTIRFVQDHVDQFTVPEPGDTPVTMFSWDVNDDVGTTYQQAGGGGSGGAPDEPMQGSISFTPAPPQNAARLLVFAPNMANEVPIEIELTVG